MAERKYYWLKLKRDFFKRHDIQIIESMPNGKDYVLFYLKLLVESVDHDGKLRFSDTIPYNEQMLATITSTNIDIVRAAMKIFTELNMVEVYDDQTIYMSEIQKLLGSETYWAEQKRKQRIGQCPTNVQLLSNMSKQEIDKDIDKDRESIGDIGGVGEKGDVVCTGLPTAAPSLSPKKQTKPKVERHKNGTYGWVLLSDAELARLHTDYGKELTARAIECVDAKAQQTHNKNKWKDWNLTVRQAIRQNWDGINDSPPTESRRTSFKIITDENGKEVAVPE